ncbi:MAG: hypothetical protein ACP5N7_06445 [Candidatus Pacearchaeota archaeon]
MYPYQKNTKKTKQIRQKVLAFSKLEELICQDIVNTGIGPKLLRSELKKKYRCKDFHLDHVFKNLKCKRIQLEIHGNQMGYRSWNYIGKLEKIEPYYYHYYGHPYIICTEDWIMLSYYIHPLSDGYFGIINKDNKTEFYKFSKISRDLEPVW